MRDEGTQIPFDGTVDRSSAEHTPIPPCSSVYDQGTPDEEP